MRNQDADTEMRMGMAMNLIKNPEQRSVQLYNAIHHNGLILRFPDTYFSVVLAKEIQLSIMTDARAHVQVLLRTFVV